MFPALDRVLHAKNKIDKAAASIARAQAVLAISKLDERQAGVLLDLAFACEEHARVFGWDLAWKTPLAIGGGDQSHHARTLQQLVKRGLVDTKKVHALACSIDPCCCRGHRRYRITLAGKQAVEQLTRKGRRR